MDALIILTIIAFWLSVALLLKHTWTYLHEKRTIFEYVSQIIHVDPYERNRKKKEKRATIFERITRSADEFAELGQRINFFSENHSVKEWLRKSGYPLNLTLARFQGLKVFLFIMGFVGGLMLFIIGFPFGNYMLVFFPLIGYFIPIVLIQREAKKRQDLIRQELPDFLDTVSTSVQAGVSLDNSLKEVIRHFQGPIREEFSRFNQEIELGVPREKAYRELLHRNDNEEFQSLIKALIQGLNLGVPVSTTFKVQSEDMREMRQEQVKELASKAAPKVTLVTTFLIAPVSILMIAGLMILNMFVGDNGMFDLF